MTALELSIGSEASFVLLETLRAQKPLVQCITNFVSMDIMANALLAVGASPAMVRAASAAVIARAHYTVTAQRANNCD